MHSNAILPTVAQEIIGIKLLHIPYEEVARAFEDFSATRAAHGERGGYITAQTPREVTDREPNSIRVVYERPEHYRVESSFSPEQKPYIGMTIALLNILARGEQRGVTNTEDADSPLPTFSQRLTEHFLRQPAETASFGAAFESATLDLLEEFGRQHPNLTPALAAMMQVAGVEGLNFTKRLVRNFLKDGLNSKLPPESPRETLGYIADPSNFVAGHVVDNILEYEVWCSGESLAKTLMRQARRSARGLARNPSIAKTYNPDQDPDIGRSRTNNFKDDIYATVSRMASDAAEAAHDGLT